MVALLRVSKLLNNQKPPKFSRISRVKAKSIPRLILLKTYDFFSLAKDVCIFRQYIAKAGYVFYAVDDVSM